jgi:hypothetical protein
VVGTGRGPLRRLLSVMTLLTFCTLGRAHAAAIATGRTD